MKDRFIIPFIASVLLLFAQGGLEGQDGGAPEADKAFRLLEQGKADKALKAFRDALAISPDNVPLLIGAGRAALLVRENSEALQFLLEAARIAPDNYDAIFFEAKAFSALGRELFDAGEMNEGAIMIQDGTGLFANAASMRPAAFESHLGIAENLVFLGDFEKADEAAKEVLSRSPGNVRALLIRGDAAFVRFQSVAASGAQAKEVKASWQQALEIYREASRLDPENPGAYMGMGALFEADKKWDKSSEAYGKALVLDPELLHGYDRLIVFLGDTEHRAELVAVLEKIIADIRKKYPGDKSKRSTPLYYCGYALFLNHDHEAAIKAYTASYGARSDYTGGALYYIARSWYALNDFRKAARSFKELFKEAPEDFQFYLSADSERESVIATISFLSNHIYNDGDQKGARDLLEGLLLVKKDSAVHFNNYAFLCRETRKYEDAYAAYSKAVELDPQNPRYLNDTALILHYHLRRDLDRAKVLYERAIKEARKIVNDAKAGTREKDDAREALRDATNNLDLLKRGVRRERRR